LKKDYLFNESSKTNDIEMNNSENSSPNVINPLSQINRYSEMGFWKFTFITSLVTIFFPWYLILNTIQRGIEDTKLLLIAMAKDWIQTIIIIALTVVVVVALGIYFLVKYFPTL
jgi:hypothetical protein